MKKIISIVLAVCVLLALCACGGKAGDKAESPAVFDGKSEHEARESTEAYMQGEHEALLDYAKRLEEAGNEEAAAAVYEIIIRNGGKDLANAAREKIDLIRTLDEIDEISEIFGEGGDVK